MLEPGVTDVFIHRERELSLLPLIPRYRLLGLTGLTGAALDDAWDYFVDVMAGLDWLYGYRVSDFAVGKLTTAQQRAHEVIVDAGLEPPRTPLR